MPEKEKSGPAIDWKTATVVLALVGGAYLIPSSLKSSRPEAKETLERTSIGDEVVPARLWQDPFEVAKTYRQQHPEKAHPSLTEQTNGSPNPRTNAFAEVHEIAEQIVRQGISEDPAKQGVTILEVMLSGGPYPEDAERRHRSRYAVLSSFSTAGYAPYDESHIGSFEIPWPRGKDLEGISSNHIPTLESLQLNGLIPDASSLVVPFEWFLPNQLKGGSPNGSVLVLWLNSEAFVDHPAKRTAQINYLLNRKVSDLPQQLGEATSRRKLTFKLLDPGLHDILDEQFADETSSPCGDIRLHESMAELQIYSSWATTADALLKSRADGTRGAAIRNALRDQGWGTNFFNATCTDDELIEEAIDELDLRGVDLANGTDAVALISEWDTFYGRAFPLTFASVVKYRMSDKVTTESLCTNYFTVTGRPSTFLRTKIPRELLDTPNLTLSQKTNLANILTSLIEGSDNQLANFVTNRENLSKAKLMHEKRMLMESAFQGAITTNRFSDAVERLKRDQNEWPANIFHFTYLRGVDGKIPGESEDESASSKGSGKDSKDREKDAQVVPRPEGHSQLDYMPRLAATILKTEHDYERQNKGAFKAIGILGSDVYDKLLVLQSLRGHFTDEIFFTTDLDARMLHPRELDWTRNVIVTSSFGFELGNALQKEIPPFRDTYQTGQYLACLAALGFPAAVSSVANSDAMLLPRRYEIGRHGAYELSIRDTSIYPPIPRASSWNSIYGDLPHFGLFLLPFAILALLVLYFSSWSRNSLQFFLAAWRPRRPLLPARHATEAGVTSNLACVLSSATATAAAPPTNTAFPRQIVSSVGSSPVTALPPDSPLPAASGYDMGSNLEQWQSLNNQSPATGLQVVECANVLQGTAPVSGVANSTVFEGSNTVPSSDYEPPPKPFDKMTWWQFRCTILGSATLAIAILVVFGLLVASDHYDRQGEPFLLTEGISIWPTELIRMLATGLGFFFLLKSLMDLQQNKEKLIRDYGLPPLITSDRVSEEWKKAHGEVKPMTPVGCVRKIFKYLAWIDIENWNRPKAFETGEQRISIDSADLQLRNDILGFWRHRLYRSIPPFLGYLLFASVIFKLLELPFVPYRGILSRKSDFVAVISSGVIQTFLIFFVVDASRLCRKFIQNVTDVEVVWPHKTFERFEKTLALKREHLGDYITINIIGDRTEAVGKLIFYPFLILFLLIFSRTSFFDRWDWPKSLILIFGLNSALAFYAVWQVRTAAEAARESALARLDESLFHALGNKGCEANADCVEQVKSLIEKIKAFKQGAFAPITQQPLIRALLMPFGGAGLLSLVEYLASR